MRRGLQLVLLIACKATHWCKIYGEEFRVHEKNVDAFMLLNR